ncbi:hypothetical protein H2248_005332 [Termitomyces sp. 'cryptogamus']|nr:hypothetical protein H2248_005332 [Termitomyces sp. 'cryptogamus']
MTSLQPENVSFTFSTEFDYEYRRVFQNISLEATHPELGSIASLSAIKIWRRFCRGSFLEIMDANSDELHQFSVKLFDNFGRVRPWLLEPGNRCGTGCWGTELNDGEIIYVLNISVVKEVRGKGLGSTMLKELVSSEHVDDRDTLMCWPTPTEFTDKSNWKFLQDKQIAFLRKNGFRRVGRTQFLAYSPNPNHLSRFIPANDDADEQGREFDPSAIDNLSAEEVKQNYPIHFAVVNTHGQEVIDTIRRHYQSDPACIHNPDASGFTPIHAALGRANLNAVQVLLELDVTEDLKNAKNIEGTTPLESLTSAMQSSREFLGIFMGQWDGYTQDDLTCEFLVKRVMGMPLISNNLEEYIAKRRWGCTCGECAGGWLSKHMRFRLCCAAGMATDGMSFEMESFQRGVPCNGVDMMDNVMCYLPLTLQQSLFKTFYVGYQSIFDAIYNFLERTDEPLSKNVILMRTLGERGVSFFFSKGGQIKYAFDAITHSSDKQSPLGDSSFEETWENDDQFMDLPTCSNDLEFSLVR